jgi:hypothetical protein
LQLTGHSPPTVPSATREDQGVVEHASRITRYIKIGLKIPPGLG